MREKESQIRLLQFYRRLRYSFDLDQEADAIEAAVEKVLEEGYRTIDIMSEGMTQIGTKEMGERICSYI